MAICDRAGAGRYKVYAVSLKVVLSKTRSVIAAGNRAQAHGALNACRISEAAHPVSRRAGPLFSGGDE